MSKPTQPRPREVFASERLVMFSDGVFAIAITLLVLELQLPEMQVDVPVFEFAQALVGLSPKFISYFISFAVIGAFWMGHHSMFRRIVRADNRLVALNLLLLFCVAFTPFPTAVLGQYVPQQPLAVIFYAATMFVAGCASTALWVYALRHPELLDPQTTKRQVTRFILRASTTPLVFLVSIVIALFDAPAAIWSWWLILILRFAADRLRRD